ncbi:hypothetical protein WJX81_005700 [Elliptochloris bilobata]|uniref:Dihydrolipoyl dehydrogenase n=1 Tax=Elliptochloris bilobata TaxID=381761 RepID=A0AAW1QM41_9CHLO
MQVATIEIYKCTNICVLLCTHAACKAVAKYSALALSTQSWKRIWHVHLAGPMRAGFPIVSGPGVRSGLAKRFARHLRNTLLFTGALGPPLRLLAPDISRTARFWSRFMPIYLRYKWTKWRFQEQRGFSAKRVEAEWQARHEWGGVRVHAMLLELSGYYVKGAQLLAAKPDFMPEPWTRRLAAMFDSMPPRSWRHVSKDIARDLQQCPAGRLHAMHGERLALDDAFAHIEPDCLAAASIAQVHGARLAPGMLAELSWRWKHGPDVVIKVQNKKMQGLMDSDVRNLGRLCCFVSSVLPFNPFLMLEEVRETVPREFDFVREACLMKALGERLRAAGHSLVLVPEPVSALTSPRLLVMQRMQGVPFTAILAGGDALARRRAAEAMTPLLDALGHLMLRGGCFHADPHAGQLLLQEDGRLVLLDWGQCKALTAARQRALAQLVVALDRGWTLGIVAAMSGMGLSFLAKEGGLADPRLIAKVAHIMFDTRSLPEARVSPLADDAVIKKIPLQRFPRDLFMVARTVMLLRGLCHALGLDIQSARVWRKHADAALRDSMLEEDRRMALRSLAFGLRRQESLIRLAAPQLIAAHWYASSGEQKDLVVVGGGPGGYVAAIKASQMGLKVACVEGRGSLGGTCLNVGCIPSKALLASSHLYHEVKKNAESHGVIVDGVKMDIGKMMAQKETAVAGLTKGIEGLFKKYKVEYVKGWGKFAGANDMEVALLDGGTTTVTAKNFIIATGSEVSPLPGMTIDEERVVSSTGAIALKEVPQKLIVIGGGYIGLEMGSVWQRLGSEVTVVEFLDHIVPSMDSEIRKNFQRSLTKQGFKFKLGYKVTGAEVTGDVVKLTVENVKDGKSEQLEASVVLVSAGRRPYVEGLDLAKVGVELDRRGRVQVDEHFKTTAPSGNIFAVGDVIDGPMLAHKAEEDGIACVENLAGKKGHVNYNTVPSIVYTHPEVASVGKTEEQVKAEGGKYRVGKFAFAANSRARSVLDTEGLVKFVSDAETDKILGVHIMGPNAGELISECVLAMEYGASTEDIARSCHGHPTLSEAVKEAAMATYDKPIHS